MISVGIKIRGLEGLRESYSAVEQSVLASAQISAEHALGQQIAQHLLANDPTGSGQKPNAEKYERQKDFGFGPRTKTETVTVTKKLKIGGETMVLTSQQTRTTKQERIAPVRPNVPLRLTGEFMLRSSWKVAYDAKRKRVRVGPYGRRARMIADQARAKGFKLLPDGLPASSLTVGRTWLQRRLDIISRTRK